MRQEHKYYKRNYQQKNIIILLDQFLKIFTDVSVAVPSQPELSQTCPSNVHILIPLLGFAFDVD